VSVVAVDERPVDVEQGRAQRAHAFA
jgi:hypothetical protein